MAEDFDPPAFLVNYYKIKVVAHLDMHITDFMKHFVTTEEEKWINFIKEQKQAMQFIDKEFERQYYYPKPFTQVLQAAKPDAIKDVKGKSDVPFHVELLQ